MFASLNPSKLLSACIFSAAVMSPLAGAATPQTFNADADAYVRSGSFAFTNFGLEDKMYVKRAITTSNNDRRSMVRFLVENIEKPVVSAKLRIKTATAQSGIPTTTTKAFIIATNWGEENVTYSAYPTFTNLAATFTPATAEQWTEIDVTTAYNTYQSGGFAAFGLQNITSGNTTLWSAYTSDSAFPPQLVITEGLEQPEGCITYTGTSLQEKTLGNGNCIVVAGGLNGKEIAIADSDANPSCDIRGTVVGSTGGSAVIDSNWELISSGFSGSFLQFTLSNNCPFLKLRVRTPQ